MTVNVSADELEKFSKAVEVVEKLGGLFKAAIVSAFTVCTFVAGIAIWVHTTSAEAQQTRDDLHALVADRSESIKEWNKWRRDKDEIDVRLTAIAEAQQKAIDRIDRRTEHP